jgi:starvation-inducible DNA-binding protein
MKLIPTRNDLPEPVRATVVALLNQQLADALDLGLQAKQAHWNVKGPGFYSLHLLFDEVAEEMEQVSDLLAERAVQLGGIAEGTAQVIVRDSRLPVYALDIYRGSEHVAAVADSLARFATSARAVISSADLAGDADTGDVFTQVSRTADTLLWKVSAHVTEMLDREPVAGNRKTSAA